MRIDGVKSVFFGEDFVCFAFSSFSLKFLKVKSYLTFLTPIKWGQKKVAH